MSFRFYEVFFSLSIHSFALKKQENGKFSPIKGILLKNVNSMGIPHTVSDCKKMQTTLYDCEVIYDSGINNLNFIQ